MKIVEILLWFAFDATNNHHLVAYLKIGIQNHIEYQTFFL
jgi:hypothetical protein